jgi:cbb3-type cytochrome c oxidase subunit II
MEHSLLFKASVFTETGWKMLRVDGRWSGWRGVCLVAITYVYFLIFAQFAFLKRLASLGIADAHLKAVMAAMAVGGISISLLAPRISLWPSQRLRLGVAFGVCAIAALLTLSPFQLAAGFIISFLIGSGLGLLTVTLVCDLRPWVGDRNPLLRVGLGTGTAYLICNFPPFFTASPQVQAITGASLCLFGGVIALTKIKETEVGQAVIPKQTVSIMRVLICFTALVWLDSAAFFIIQNTPTLKAGTWQGSLHLGANGLLHFAAALTSAWLLRRRGLPPVVSLSFVALASACLLLISPDRALLASVFYPIGVSLYSVALVAYPSLLAPVSSVAARGRQAGWIYAIAGWFGSAMGIGMGQNLGHVPPTFVLAAGLLMFAPEIPRVLRRRKRELAATLAILIAAFCIDRTVKKIDPDRSELSQVERGRKVYISEGCINCHSQYVRPNTPDVVMWGPVQTVEELRREHPPLIGNRRQGPDLAEVGGRRSALWLRAHFFKPAQVSHASIMPSYSHLFRDDRGEDLLVYISSLQAGDVSEHRLREKAWQASPAALARGNAKDGERLFNVYCSTCHNSDGRTRHDWKTNFKRLPPDFTTGPFLYVLDSESPQQRLERIAQITKFGLPGTDMPGHEYLSDNEIASLSLWLEQTTAASVSYRQTSSAHGERQ